MAKKSLKKTNFQERFLALGRREFIPEAVKTSLSATLALYLAGLFRLPEPYWAAVSAIIVLQSDLSLLVSASVSRLAGTAIGALVGACAVTWMGNSLWSFALAVIVATVICAIVGYWETYRFSAVTVVIIMLITRQASPWIVALHRFLEVSFGIGVAFIVSLAYQKFGPAGASSLKSRTGRSQ